MCAERHEIEVTDEMLDAAMDCLLAEARKDGYRDVEVIHPETIRAVIEAALRKRAT